MELLWTSKKILIEELLRGMSENIKFKINNEFEITK